MAHSTVWGHPPNQRQNTNSKSRRLKSCLRAVTEGVQSLVKLIQMMNEITLSLILHFIWISGFIWVTSSAENIDLARERN